MPGGSETPPGRYGDARAAHAGPLARALALSLLVHAIVVAALAALVGVGGAGGDPRISAPLVAKLAAPQRYEVAPILPAPPSALDPTVPAETTSRLPVPLVQPREVVAFKGSRQGMVTINRVPPDVDVDPAFAQLAAKFDRNAVRVTPEFDVEPVGTYPQGAVARRRQIDMLVPVVMREDGRVEVLPGTYLDPLFGPAIQFALEQARARPMANAAGLIVPTWGVLSFAFEFVGERSTTK